jgi:peptide deformylase
MIRKILNVKDPRLRNKSTSVGKIDKKIESLITDLKDTLKAQKDPEGVGLAAPQIGVNKRIFIMMPEGKIRVVINPKVLSVGKPSQNKGQKKIMEGCLSLPHYYSPIRKPNEITISYTTEKGEKITKTFREFDAQIVAHEVDHLEGILFVDHVLKQHKPIYKFSNGEWEEVELA